MECTQRLECTQNTYDIAPERTCPEQIGFLGICGSKEPVKKGPNKIGRDPQTCSIVLNDNSISRQHAVINILNKRDFMLMDLDSSNKTKLLGKTLQPYIPHPLKNGDTVQFGQLFGIFRLLEEDDDLPMTQAVEIPDTPINIRHTSRLKPTLVTTIPESPDVSDRDDSIIAQSHSKKNSDCKSSYNNSMKTLEKVNGIEQSDCNMIDNMYWNSSKKSDSFNSKFERSFTVTNTSKSSKKVSIDQSIYEMETQAPGCARTCLDNETSDSIYEANTQVPNSRSSSKIHNSETKVPNIEKLPEVFKLKDQSNIQLNLYSTDGKYNIFEAETQITIQDKETRVTLFPVSMVTDDQERDATTSTNKKLNSSDEEICFDEVDCHQQEDECGSQPLLPPDPCDLENLIGPFPNGKIQENINIENNKITCNDVLNGSDSKDCEEIAPSQKITETPTDDEDVTDCEDNLIEAVVNSAELTNKIKSANNEPNSLVDLNNIQVNDKSKLTTDDDLTDCEDDIIEISQNRSQATHSFQQFEDLPTQDLKTLESGEDNVPFEDMLTQVIGECPIETDVTIQTKNTDKSEFSEDHPLHDIVLPQKQISSTPQRLTNNNNFKYPLPSPRLKKKDPISLKQPKFNSEIIKESPLLNIIDDDQNYYNATQEVLNDLCTQNAPIHSIPNSKYGQNCISTEKNVLTREKSSAGRDASNINSFVSNLSKEQVLKVIGADAYVAPLSKKKSSDSSDLEVTPKKFSLSKFLLIDLPNSQEIKSCDFISSKIDTTDSDDENTEKNENGEDIIHAGYHKKGRTKDIKVNLMKKFDVNVLPKRTTTRARKPTSKVLENNTTQKSNFELDKEHEFNRDVLQSKLKLPSKVEEAKNKIKSKKSEKDQKDSLSKNIEKEKNSKKTNRNKTKESIQKNKTDLKQQNIETMFLEPISKNLNIVENVSNAIETIDSSHKCRRSSRNKDRENKQEKIKPVIKERKSEPSENKKSRSRTYRSRKQVKEINYITTEEEEKERIPRRSRRHENTSDKKGRSLGNKEKIESNKSEAILTTSSKSNMKDMSSIDDHSKVYNLSSEATVDSPAALKRQATSEIISNSKPKRAKSSSLVNASTTRAISVRGVKIQYVLFTAFPCEEVKVKLEKLGAVIVSDVKSCTVVLTLQLRRTFKLLCALGLGKPIVGPNWVQACADSNIIVDPWLYLMKDEVTERRFGFNLRQSLTCKRNFLRGFNVSCTPNVTPSPPEMKAIVECSGGVWKEGGRSWFCVSCSADKELWPGLRKRGVTLVSTEFILGGVLQQRINLDRDKLV